MADLDDRNAGASSRRSGTKTIDKAANINEPLAMQ